MECECCGEEKECYQADVGYVECICGLCDNNLCPTCRVDDKGCINCTTTYYPFSYYGRPYCKDYSDAALIKNRLTNDLDQYYCRKCRTGWIVDRNTRKSIVSY